MLQMESAGKGNEHIFEVNVGRKNIKERNIKVYITIATFKMNISLLLPLRSSHSGMFSKNIFSQMFFQYCCSEILIQFLEKYQWWNAIFLKFGAEELSFIASFFKTGIQSMQVWTTSMRQGVTRKRSIKILKHTGNLFRKNLQLRDAC